MCTVMDLPTSILAPLFAPLMFAGRPNHFPLLTMFRKATRIRELPRNAVTDRNMLSAEIRSFVDVSIWLSIGVVKMFQSVLQVLCKVCFTIIECVSDSTEISLLLRRLAASPLTCACVTSNPNPSYAGYLEARLLTLHRSATYM